MPRSCSASTARCTASASRLRSASSPRSFPRCWSCPRCCIGSHAERANVLSSSPVPPPPSDRNRVRTAAGWPRCSGLATSLPRALFERRVRRDVQKLAELRVRFFGAAERAQGLNSRCRAFFGQRTARKLALMLGERRERFLWPPCVQLGLSAGQQRDLLTQT